MSLRNYIVVTILVLGCTFVISKWQEKQGTLEILKVFFQVMVFFVVVVGGVFLLAKVLAHFGIAQSGFFI